MRNIKNISAALSLLTAVLFALAGLTSVLKITIPSLIFGFILIPCFIAVMVFVHYLFGKKMKVFSMLGIVFAVMYGSLISFNYFLQIVLMQKNIPGLDLFSMTSPNSIFMTIEVLGYFFMGLSTLSAALVFGSTFTERLIKLIFITNGLLGVGGLVGYGLGMSMEIMYLGLMVWNVIMPIAVSLLIYRFKTLPEREM